VSDIDEIYDITDPAQQQDWFFSGIPVRRPGSAKPAECSPRMVAGRRAWIRKLLGENNEQAPSGGRKISRNHDHVDGCTRHKEEMKIRGDMVIEMAKALVVFDPATVPEFWIKMARETAEARYRDR